MAARVIERVVGRINVRSQSTGVLSRTLKKSEHERSNVTKAAGPDFGLFFDIDGVIVRGRTLLQKGREALQLLTNEKGKFWVPTIFVTNAGNALRQTKALQLSDWLGVEVKPDQVIMSHSPLKMFRQFQDKHVLISGQGPIREIAKQLGFSKVTTTDTLRQCFPMLDMVDHRRRAVAPCAFERYFPRIEAVILFGEPIRWETNLQLILDVLVSDGCPGEAPASIPYPHIPILGCNMDLMWMSEAKMPRFGHGCFLHCLESLYKKVTGNDMKYTALVGKPSEITYHHAEHVLQTEAKKMGLPGIHRMYCIGDNPDVDIYGANLYNQYIQKKKEKSVVRKVAQKGAASIGPTSDFDVNTPIEETLDELSTEDEVIETQECHSVLVQTGVYDGNSNTQDDAAREILDHSHRDFIMDPEMRKPCIEVHNAYDAVRVIFKREGLS